MINDQFLDYMTPIYSHCFHMTPMFVSIWPQYTVIVSKIIPKSRNHSKPWFTPGLLTLCKRKNYLYKQAKITPTPDNKAKYNKYRNKYNNKIKIARKQYYHNKLNSISSSLRETWSVIKTVISKKQSTKKPMVMKDSDGQYFNLKQIVHKFNNYFTNVGPAMFDFRTFLCHENRLRMVCVWSQTRLQSSHQAVCELLCLYGKQP